MRSVYVAVFALGSVVILVFFHIFFFFDTFNTLLFKKAKNALHNCIPTPCARACVSVCVCVNAVLKRRLTDYGEWRGKRSGFAYIPGHLGIPGIPGIPYRIYLNVRRV